MFAVRATPSTFSAASSGTPPILTLRVSDPSVSTNTAEMSSGMSVFSAPVASETSRSGAIAATSTLMVWVVVAKESFSASSERASTVRLKSAGTS